MNPTSIISLFFIVFLAKAYHIDSGFKGKVVLVSGGTSGIGFATVKELARSGAHVVFCARDSHPNWYNGSHTEKLINNDGFTQIVGGSAKFVKADMRVPEEVRNFINVAHETYGKIDYAVNNAGIGGWAVNTGDITDEMLFSEYDPIKNNLYGVINLMREQIKYFSTHGDKEGVYSIINLSSENGVRSCPGCSLYGAAKYAIIGMSKSAAMEYVSTKPRIRVNVIAPGLINTPLTRNQIKSDQGLQPWEGPLITEDNPDWIKQKPAFEKMLAGKTLGEPRQLAQMIMMVLDNSMNYVTGTVIEVDNGSTAQ